MASELDIRRADQYNKTPPMLGASVLQKDAIFNPLWERGSRNEAIAYMAALIQIDRLVEEGVIDGEGRRELIRILGLYEILDEYTGVRHVSLDKRPKPKTSTK